MRSLNAGLGGSDAGSVDAVGSFRQVGLGQNGFGQEELNRYAAAHYVILNPRALDRAA